MKSSTLTNYVIIFLFISTVILLISYMGLTWTTRKIPSDMITIGFALAAGVVAAGIRQSITRPGPQIEESFINFSLMGLATTQLALVINYNSLIWAERSIPEGSAWAIQGLVAIILSSTNFGGSGRKKADSLPHEDELIDQEKDIDIN